MPAADSFFDTNILLYLLSDDATKTDRTEVLLAAGGVISVQVLNEFASVALGKKALDFGELGEIFAAIRAACTIRPLDIETHDLGFRIVARYRFSVYDSMIVAAALKARCSILYSEDLQHGQRIDHLSIRNPFIE